MVGCRLLLASSLLHAERAKGDALVELHVVADHRGFPDDDAGAVIDEEGVSDGGARVDVDARLAVHVFAHHAGDHGHAAHPQLVGNAVHEDGLHGRVGEDHLLLRACRGVSPEGGLHVPA